MDISTARSIGQKLQISIDSIVREEYEILLLKEVFESEFGLSLVFKGGTALRLAYNSARFSEDLDFTLIKKINRKKFIVFLKEVKTDLAGYNKKEVKAVLHRLLPKNFWKVVAIWLE